MQCLQHFDTWPVYPRKLDDLITSSCTPDRLGQGAAEGRAATVAEQWTDCLGRMLVLDPNQRAGAQEVLQAVYWEPSLLDGEEVLPKLRQRRSISSAGGGSQGSDRCKENCNNYNKEATTHTQQEQQQQEQQQQQQQQQQCRRVRTQEVLAATADKPKLARMSGIRRSHPQSEQVLIVQMAATIHVHTVIFLLLIASITERRGRGYDRRRRLYLIEGYTSFCLISNTVRVDSIGSLSDS
jgi:hypothetical protein